MDGLLTVPSPKSPSAASFSSKSSKRSKPLSSHGMPKEPLPSPGRPHRFSHLGATTSPPPASPVPPLSPMSPMSATSPPPMSPPTSAKSFGTFIDSEPSTPAYSPRMGSNWDGSTLVLLSPVSVGSKNPKEPAWEMMAPPAPKSKKRTTITKTSPFPLLKEISTTTSLSSHPSQKREVEVQKENVSPPTAEGEAESESKPKEESSLSTAPLTKLATKMKHMLRRKSASEKSEIKEKKSEKRRREYEDVDRLEDLHWTEM